MDGGGGEEREGLVSCPMDKIMVKAEKVPYSPVKALSGKGGLRTS